MRNGSGVVSLVEDGRCLAYVAWFVWRKKGLPDLLYFDAPFLEVTFLNCGLPVVQITDIWLVSKVFLGRTLINKHDSLGLVGLVYLWCLTLVMLGMHESPRSLLDFIDPHLIDRGQIARKTNLILGKAFESTGYLCLQEIKVLPALCGLRLSKVRFLPRLNTIQKT